MKLDSVNHIGIIGAGMIGDSLAVLATGHGYRTTVVVRRAEMIPEYKKTYDEYFRQMIEQGLMPEEQLAICEKYLTYCGDFGALSENACPRSSSSSTTSTPGSNRRAPRSRRSAL
jgi:3-hydroxybutyryl-CoA dehydrogenase